MAHYGKRTGDAAMQREACHWYDKGLENQRLESHEMELQLANGARAVDKISEATICAPIMFSLFESLMTTSFTAWAQHMTAAGKMLELRGPEKCQDGIIHHLFRSVRIGSIYIGLMFEIPSIFASEEWCRVPFAKHEKVPFDKLADILLQVPRIFILRNSMRSLRERSHEAYEPTRRAVEDEAQRLISWLSRYWDACADTINLGYDHSRFVELSGFQADAADWIVEETSMTHFEDTFAATNVAMYDAAVVLANALAWEAAPSDADVYKQRIATHCASILAVVSYHEGRGVGSGGTITMVFPMKIVCRVTPSNHQRHLAEAALLKWGKSRGMDGICKFSVVPERNGIYNQIRRTEEARSRYSGTARDPRYLALDPSSSLGADHVPPPQLWAGTLLHAHRLRI